MKQCETIIYRILISLLACAAIFPARAKQRTQANMFEEASSVLIKSNPGSFRSPMRNAGLTILESNEAFSIIGFEGGSYAIISNDDLLPAVLGYSSSPLGEHSDNPAFEWWSRSIKEVAAEIVKAGAAPDITVPEPGRFPSDVPQLMSNVWGQMEPFNNLCPLEYDSRGRLIGRSVVGCVATSATQVMHYHRYPPKGEGVHIDMQTSDAKGNTIPLKVDFADYNFDYDNMLDSYSVGNYTEEQARAVAELAYPVGVSFGMIYGTGASGTYSDSAVYSLRKYLKFPDATLMVRSRYSEKQWMETIYEELSNGRPVLYSGADPWGTIGGGGHAFVFDGYNADGLVHVNWGWYGRNDGYYQVGLLNPRIHSFVNQQDMIIHVAPPQSLEEKSEKFTGKLTVNDFKDIINRSQTDGLREIDLSAAALEDGALPKMAFFGSRLRKIILPESMKEIGEGAFAHCRDLMEVVFPEADSSQKFIVEDDVIYSRDGEEVIAVLPYYHNYEPVITDYTSLLKFKKGVKRIAAHAADGCFRIQGVEIPSSVNKIGAGAFDNTTTLKVVCCNGATPANMAARAFSTLDPGFTKLLVPAGSADAYYRAGEWNRFFAFDNVYEYGTNVRARNIVRNVGEPNPELTYQIFGDYIYGEPELTCEATQDSPAGEYPIIVSMGTLYGSDDITLTDGVMRVIDPENPYVAVTETEGEKCFNVYSIDGKLILENAESLEDLEKGMYIINGRKVLKN